MDGHMFDGLPKLLVAIAVVMLVVGVAIGALIAWLVLA